MPLLSFRMLCSSYFKMIKTNATTITTAILFMCLLPWTRNNGSTG